MARSCGQYRPVQRNFPVNYPLTWLRLTRSGNIFSGFAGYDGATWTLLGSATISFSNQVCFGFAVSSHVQAQVATAQFRDLADVTNAVVGVVANPHEALGPCSRKTPIIISEIMYKPAPARGHQQSGVCRDLQLQPLVSGHQRLPAHFGQYELHLSARDDPQWRRVPGGGGLAFEHGERLWHHQCPGALHWQPQEGRHSPTPGRAAARCC